MKYIWEEKDIKGGRIVQKPGAGITGTWMIGWRTRPREERVVGDPDRGYGSNMFFLISLADGMLLPTDDGTRNALVKHLNACGYYIPIEHMDSAAGCFKEMPRLW